MGEAGWGPWRERKMKMQSGNGGVIFNRRWKRGNVDAGVKGGDEVKDRGVMVEVWDWWMKSIEMEGKRSSAERWRQAC